MKNVELVREKLLELGAIADLPENETNGKKSVECLLEIMDLIENDVTDSFEEIMSAIEEKCDDSMFIVSIYLTFLGYYVSDFVFEMQGEYEDDERKNPIKDAFQEADELLTLGFTLREKFGIGE